MDDDKPKRGRPQGSKTGTTPLRTLRLGPLWDQGKAVAQAHGMTMTALVEEALRREIARMERQDRREGQSIGERLETAAKEAAEAIASQYR
jgi:hypothetical protein